jgi:2-keto-4-pentenoate hydratase/2-oxohepta-3-ene-1,7-dioic acid hydratase in catechol pathway
MKISRCANGGNIFWAVVDVAAKEVRPIAGAFAEWAPDVTAGKGEAALRFVGGAMPLASVTLLPPIEKTNKVVVAGANYAKHLVEFGLAAPAQPIAFLKTYGALIGANDPISYPELTKELDYEVELVVVVGTSHVDRADPLSGVLGYTVGNDVSSRDLQRSGPPGIGMDLFAAKSQDKTTGLGPWIVTRDEFPPGSPKLQMKLRVNDEIRQDASTGEMTWNVAELMRFVDSRSRFECGDILFTGTPTGVGQASGRYLQPGDMVEASIEGIGALRNKVGPRPT